MTACYQLLAAVVPDLHGSVADLTRRLRDTRWISLQVSGKNATRSMQTYVEAWMTWLRQPPGEPFGRLEYLVTAVGEARLVRFQGRGRVPLMLLHGWPTSLLAFHRVIEPLLDLASDVVLAILPGFGAPKPRTGDMSVPSIAALLAEAMLTFGNQRFIVHGQDWGSAIAREMAIQFPDRLAGVHVSAGIAGFMAEGPECGLQWERLRGFAAEGAGYLSLQSNRPDSLAIGMGDSPAGLLSWQLDKFRLWQASLGSDYGLGEDFIFANATYYWVTGSIGSSMHIYADNRAAPSDRKSYVPTGVSVFGTGDFASRRVAARDNNLVAWYEHSNGGHVASLDSATDFVTDLSDFINRAEVIA